MDLKVFRFFIMGLLATIVHYSVLLALVELYGIYPVTASGCGAVAGLFVNYFLNYRFTFRSNLPHGKTFSKYFVIAMTGLMLNLGLMALFTPYVFYFYAQLMATAIVFAWSFLANSLWTFKNADKCTQNP